MEAQIQVPSEDPSKTLDAGIPIQGSSSSNSDYQSPLSGEVCPESHDSALLLEYPVEANGAEVDRVLNSSPGHTAFCSNLDCGEVRSNPSESQTPLPLSNVVPSDWPSAGHVSSPFLSAILAQSHRPIVAGAGLANLGNTCFLNSVLQCFIHTVPLLEGICSDAHSVHSSCNKGGFCILCALRQLVDLSLASTGRVICPWSFVDNLSYFSSSFQKLQQEDAHEFLQCFLDRLESFYDAEQKECGPSKCDNVVKQVFGGCLVSKLKCCSCGHCSDTYEPSIDLSLEIEDADDLLTALQSFTKVEKLEDPETKFTCGSCKEQVSVEKQLSFDQAPMVAAFHLKRFKNDGYLVQKIDKHVSFPLDLDLLPFTANGKRNDEELKYVLHAIVVHIGLTATSGHYYCFIRLSPNMWCKFDDSRVVLVHEDYVLSQEAYILFYAKEGTPWFLSFIEARRSLSDSIIWNTSPKSVLDNADAVSPLQDKSANDSNEASDDVVVPEHRVGKIEVIYSRSTCRNVESDERKDNLPGTSASVAAHAHDSSDALWHEAQTEPSPLEKANWSQDVSAEGNSRDAPEIPVRSPSPEIYREDPPNAGFSIPRDHLKVADRVSCKRRLEKEMDDMEVKQACTLIKKSIPGLRRQQLLSAVTEGKMEGRKKGRRSEFSPRW